MTYETVVRVHLAFGTATLVAFWLQMITRKGSALHRSVGKLYAVTLSVVILSAIPMTVILSIRQHWAAAVVLGFLLWITFSAGFGALLAVRWRNRRLERQRTISRVLSVGLLLISLALLALSPLGGVLFLGLGGLGTWGAISDLRLPKDALVWRSWLARHIEGVMGTGIAAHVAFLAFGLSSLLGRSFTNVHFLLAFLVPTVVGFAAASKLTSRHVPDDRIPSGGGGALAQHTASELH